MNKLIKTETCSICGNHGSEKEHDNPASEELGELIRDLTKVGSIAKSEARRRIEALLQAEREKAYEDLRKGYPAGYVDGLSAGEIKARSSFADELIKEVEGVDIDSLSVELANSHFQDTTDPVWQDLRTDSTEAMIKFSSEIIAKIKAMKEI